MTIFRHELKQGKISLLVWAFIFSFLLAVCVFIYPDMKGEMDAISDTFASMGGFTDAFGMDKVSFGTLIGYYTIECGNMLGIGGVIFASILGISALSKEEKDSTAEFLLTRPISRSRVVTEKLLAILVQVVVLNIVVMAVSVCSISLIGEKIPWKEFYQIHIAYFFMQIEISVICFAISAFLRKGGMATGIGFGALMYFLNLISNLTEDAEILKYITPFGYCDGADIVSNGELDLLLIALGMIYSVVALIIGYIKYNRKDIFS